MAGVDRKEKRSLLVMMIGEANNNVVVVSWLRNTRGNLIFDVNGSQTKRVVKALASHLKCGPGEEQGNRSINSGFCNISGCEVNTSVPVKCDTSYDNATSYADRCRNVCNHDCAKEASLIPELDGTLLFCSQNNNSDKYCNEELQNNTLKRNNNKLHRNNKDKERYCHCESSKHDNDPDFTTSSSEEEK